MKYIITEEQSIKLRRRIQYINNFLDVTLDNMNPCDYSNDSHFYVGVIYELEVHLDLFTFNDLSSEEIINYIKKNKKDYISQYYINSQEDC
jgi:hypothetical protein